MDVGDRIYQAERTLSVAEQQAVDAANGELIASVARLWRRTAERLPDQDGSGPTARRRPERVAADEAQHPGLGSGVRRHLDPGPVLAGGAHSLLELLHAGQ
jgi:hypothetical protein